MGIIGAIIASICYLALIGYGVYTIYTFVKKLFSSNQNTKNLISVPTQANAVKAINVADAKSVQRNTAIRESSSEITDEHIQAIKKSIGSLEELYSEIKNHHNPVEFDTSSKFKNQLSNAKQEIRDLILSLYTPADIDEHEQRFYEIFRNGFCVKKVNKFFFGRINIEKRTFSALKTCFKIDKKILDIGNNAANFEKEEISKNKSNLPMEVHGKIAGKDKIILDRAIDIYCEIGKATIEYIIENDGKNEGRLRELHSILSQKREDIISDPIIAKEIIEDPIVEEGIIEDPVVEKRVIKGIKRELRDLRKIMHKILEDFCFEDNDVEAVVDNWVAMAKEDLRNFFIVFLYPKIDTLPSFIKNILINELGDGSIKDFNEHEKFIVNGGVFKKYLKIIDIRNTLLKQENSCDEFTEEFMRQYVAVLTPITAYTEINENSGTLISLDEKLEEILKYAYILFEKQRDEPVEDAWDSISDILDTFYVHTVCVVELESFYTNNADNLEDIVGEEQIENCVRASVAEACFLVLSLYKEDAPRLQKIDYILKYWCGFENNNYVGKESVHLQNCPVLRAILAENFGRVLTGNMTLDFEDEFENDLIDRYHKIGANVINFLEENNDDKKEEKKLDLLNSLNDIARTAQDEVVLNVAEAIQENSEESSKHKIVSKDEETDMSAKKDVKFNSLSTKSVNELMAELNELVGLKEVKDDVSSMINLLRIKKMREEKGFRQDDMSMHLVFSGNPGTGKTTVARLLSSIYRAMGFLEKGHLVEVDRSGLVGGYVGQTALKVQEVVNKSLDGILFIDEAYALTNQGHGGSDSFGIEAVNTLLKAMEDNRNRLVVIIAGYPDLMESFLSSNPGMKSRFNKHLFFADYQPDELLAIFELLCNKGGWILQEQAKEYVKGHFSALYANRGDTFANGRDVRNYFEKIVVNHANRTAKLQNIKDSDLNLLLLDDVQVKSGITISSDVDGSSGDTQNYQNIPVADNIQINPQVHNQLQSVDGNIVDNASDCHKFIFYPEFNEFPWQATLHNSLWRNRFMGSIANYKITENAK